MKVLVLLHMYTLNTSDVVSLLLHNNFVLLKSCSRM